MAEISSGIRSILSHPWVYRGLREVLGLNRWLARYVASYVKPVVGDRLLDIGCGTGEIVRYLSGVDYVGVDRHRPYIDHAHKHFADQGRFICADVAGHIDEFRSSFDLVTANGLLHHLDDDLACRLFEIGSSVLGTAGRMVTVDPCFHDGQPALARFIIERDRGQNVRRPEQYLALALSTFPCVRKHVWQGFAPIPFSVTVLECAMKESALRTAA